ncbi:MAG: response regulator [Patescibacteria group bacterium]|nr:response regulator [Patescibacteria group bacterium]
MAKKILNKKSQGSSSGKKILIIEDDRFLRELIVRKLSDEGFVTAEAMDGEKGIKKVKEENPDLVLLDLILPGIDGFEVLSRMKKDESLKSIPVIILSNLGQKEEVEKGLKMGAVDYLIKAHFTPGEIIEKIKGSLK